MTRGGDLCIAIFYSFFFLKKNNNTIVQVKEERQCFLEQVGPISLSATGCCVGSSEDRPRNRMLAMPLLPASLKMKIK